MSTTKLHKYIEKQFTKKSKARSVKVYEAPASGHWVVIANGVAWVAASDAEEFVFWGPEQRQAITFAAPE